MVATCRPNGYTRPFCEAHGGTQRLTEAKRNPQMWRLELCTFSMSAVPNVNQLIAYSSPNPTLWSMTAVEAHGMPREGTVYQKGHVMFFWDLSQF